MSLARTADLCAPGSRPGGELVAEHGQPAYRPGAGDLALPHIPMLGQLAVLHPHYVGGDHRGRVAVAGAAEPAVEHHLVAVSKDELILITECLRQGPDQVEQAVPAGADVRAVLDVVIGPVLRGRGVV